MALDTILNITANTRPAEQQIDRLTSKNYGIKLNIDSQPLGRITGQLSEFNKSMDAANARVVAFGASAGAIAVLEKSFRAMIDSTIQVEKSLKDIQVVLDVSGESMAKFGKGLFDIAKNTGQSFSVAAEAATEFSRQGLSMEDTLKRTSDALILSRLSGLGAAESVNVLTAAVNSFANQGVTATEVVNKLATVDAAFAVSSKDLAEGISRVGASASQSGVSIDELIGLITSAQQATARGGAVIGNSFKTIFTRLERGKTQSLLESLGVDTKDETGKIKSTVDMLKDLAKVYGTLGQGKQAEVAEKVGGVFQINILKAALADLGKEHSVYAGAVDISNNATDEATKRNEKLNETYSAQINRLQQGATQLAAAAGKRVLGPSMDRVIGAGNGILDNLNNVDSSSIGAKLGKGLLDGIGQVIAGPGLVLLGGVIIKLLGDFSKFAGGSVKELLGLNSASKEQAAIQSSITKLLEKNPALLAQINSEAKTQSDQAKILLDFYMKQTAEMQKQAALTGQLAGKLYTGGVRMGTEGVPVTKKAAGYIPEFASEEAQAKMLGAHNPKAEWGKGTIGGQRFIKNSEETEIPNFGTNGDSAVIPHYAKGYIPNFADDYVQGAKKRRAQRSNATSRKGQGTLRGEIDAAGFAELLVPIDPREAITQSVSKNDRDILVKNIAVRTFKQGAIKEESRKDAGKIVETIASASFPAITDYINNLSPLGSPPLSKQDLENSFKQGSDAKGAYGALQAFAGSAFESGITKAIGYHSEKSNGNQGDFDVRGGTNLKLLQQLFGLSTSLGDFKISDSSGNLLSFAAKVVKEKGGRDAVLKTKRAAAGYVPNFADRVGIVTGDVIRGNEYKEVLQYLANTTKPISTILGPAGVGKTTRAASMGGQLLRSFAEIGKFDKFILDRAGFDVPQKDTVTAENIKKIFAKSNAAGSLDILFGSRNTVASLRERRLQEGDQIIGERNNLRGGSSGVGSFTRGIRGFLGEYENANVLRMRKSGDQYGLSKVNFANGYVPNFADALRESIAREISAGAPANDIYVKKYGQLASQNNPEGYGVFNRRDEGSMSKEMTAMRNKGYAKGYIPNFADEGAGQVSGSGTATLGVTGFADMVMMFALMKRSSGEATSALREEFATKKSILSQEIAINNELIQSEAKKLKAELELGAKSKLTAVELDAMSRSITTLTSETRAAKVSLGAAKPSFAQISTAGTKDFFKGGGATSAAIFAPLIAAQIAEMMPKNTPTQRGAASTVTGMGNVASMAGTGFMLGGPWGAAAGGAIAALQEIPKAVIAFTSKLPELEAASSRAKDNLDEFNSRSATYVTAYDNYKSALDSGSASEQNLKKLRDAYGKALSTMSGGDIKRITAARVSGGEEGERSEIASISEEKRLKSQSAEKNVELAKIRDEQESKALKRGILGMGVLGGADKIKSLMGGIENITGVKAPEMSKTVLNMLPDAESFGLGGLRRGSKESQKIGDILAQGSLAGFGGDKQKELDFIKGIDLKSLRKVNTTEELRGMLTNQYKDKTGKVSEEDQNKIDQAVKIAEATGNANLVANEFADTLGRVFKANKSVIEIIRESDKVLAEDAGVILKWQLAIKELNNASLRQVELTNSVAESTKKANAVMAQGTRGAILDILKKDFAPSDKIDNLGYSNKVQTLTENSSVEKSRIISTFLDGLAKDISTVINTIEKASPENNPTSTKGIGSPLSTTSREAGEMYDRIQQATPDLASGIESIRSAFEKTGNMQQFVQQSNVLLTSILTKIDIKGTEQEKLLSQNNIKLQDANFAIQKNTIDTIKSLENLAKDRNIEELKKAVTNISGSVGGIADFANGNKTLKDSLGSILSGAGGIAQTSKAREDLERQIRSGQTAGREAIDKRTGLKTEEKYDETIGRQVDAQIERIRKIAPGLQVEQGSNAYNSILKGRQAALVSSFTESQLAADSAKGRDKEQKQGDLKQVTDILKSQLEKLNNAARGAGLEAPYKNVSQKTTRELMMDYGDIQTKMSTGQAPDWMVKIFGDPQQQQAMALKENTVALNDLKNVISGFGGKEGVMSGDKNLVPVTDSKYKAPTMDSAYGPGGSQDAGGFLSLRQNEGQKRQQQQQEAAGGKSGGGNVTVAAPQINITVNGGAGGADELHRNVVSLMPQLKADIEKTVRIVFERDINSMRGQIQKLSYANPSARAQPIPIGIDKSSATA